MANPVELASFASSVMWIGIAAVVLVLGYYAYKWLRGLYDDFTAPGGEAEAQIVNMFTPHNDDGSVAPKDVPLKSADPIDWLFMDHDASEPI